VRLVLEHAARLKQQQSSPRSDATTTTAATSAAEETGVAEAEWQQAVVRSWKWCLCH
jgi:hypothetical protein